MPTYIEAILLISADDTDALFPCAKRIDLYELGIPVWLEHPYAKLKYDVVAIPFRRPSDVPDSIYPSADSVGAQSIPIRPGTTIFIVGFVSGIHVGYGLPIWKSGYVASEPLFDVYIEARPHYERGRISGKRLPVILLDALTRPGMSGSPVFATYYGAWDPNRPYSPPDFRVLQGMGNNLYGQGCEFIGVYSGRVGSQQDAATIGLCWKRAVIEEICKSGYVGSNPHSG